MLRTQTPFRHRRGPPAGAPRVGSRPRSNCLLRRPGSTAHVPWRLRCRAGERIRPRRGTTEHRSPGIGSTQWNWRDRPAYRRSPPTATLREHRRQLPQRSSPLAQLRDRHQRHNRSPQERTGPRKAVSIVPLRGFAPCQSTFDGVFGAGANSTHSCRAPDPRVAAVAIGRQREEHRRELAR